MDDGWSAGCAVEDGGFCSRCACVFCSSFFVPGSDEGLVGTQGCSSSTLQLDIISSARALTSSAPLLIYRVRACRPRSEMVRRLTLLQDPSSYPPVSANGATGYIPSLHKPVRMGNHRRGLDW